MNKIIKSRYIAPGKATGHILFMQNQPSDSPPQQKLDVAEELNRFGALTESIFAELTLAQSEFNAQGAAESADIIESHKMLLTDKGFQDKVNQLISEELISVGIAVKTVLTEIIKRFSAAENEYLRQRADDLVDIIHYFQSKKWELDGLPEMQLQRDTVLFLPAVFPSTMLACRNIPVTGLIVEHGVPTSHAAILAKSLGIPVAIGGPEIRDLLPEGTRVLLDSPGQAIHVDPSAELLEQLHREQVLEKEHTDILPQQAGTADGMRIRLEVNIERLDELDLLDVEVVDGIGLFRTEFLFMNGNRDFPAIEKQVTWYRKALDMMQGKPVTFRILDIGGDKFLSYFSLGPQDNPYLGLRAHRIFRYHPQVLEQQLQAFLQAAGGRDLKILFPMINGPEDFQEVNEILNRARQNYPNGIEVGVMIETPAAVFNLDRILPLVDFISIGTNDLVQYVLAVDRNNENVMDHYKPTMPVIIRILDQILRAAQAAGKPVSLCGELASDPLWTPLLLGLGFRHLSVSPFAFSTISNRLVVLDSKKCEQLAVQVLAARLEKEVLALLESYDPQTGQQNRLTQA